jgi:ABC-type branched-subunit amino acid transport system ATPase component
VTTPLLEARGARRAFGGVTAVAGVSFALAPGEIRAVIGPNGAGKTTLLNLVSGLLPLDGGTISFRGRPLNGLGPAARAGLGIARTFQNLQVFAGMTVLENVMVGRHQRSRCGFLAAALATPPARREERRIVDAARACLAFVGLETRAEDQAASLPFAQQRLLEIARALAMEPALLLLDEPAAGLNAVEVERLTTLVGAVRARGHTIVLVEHHMDLVMRVSDRILVLDHGEVLAEGLPNAIRSDPAVIDAYLGAEDLVEGLHA